MASKYLVDIVLNNLLSNAVRHNLTGGEIIITLKDAGLTIKNNGDHAGLVEASVFERFKKGKTSYGTGLGLTIVKNICAYYNFKIGYKYVDTWHIFTIDFSE